MNMGLNLLRLFKRPSALRSTESHFTSSLMTYQVDDLTRIEERAHHAGDLALMHAAMNELARLSPKHPLLMPDVARAVYDKGANTFRDRGWDAATKVVADPQTILTELKIDFEGQRQRMIDALAASPIESHTQRTLLLFRRRTVSWRGRLYPTERAAKAAKNSELARLRASVLGEHLEPRPSRKQSQQPRVVRKSFA